jgi:SAM-dependent methyltransferase
MEFILMPKSSQNTDTNPVFSNRKIWEQLYTSGQKINRYPHDGVVSFTLGSFGKKERQKVRILDYGCGGGGNSTFMADAGFDVYAIDYSFTATHLTADAMKRINPLNPGNAVVADFNKLPFPDNFFHAVIDRQSLDQNPAANLEPMVNEIHRILLPGGRYYGVNFSDGHPQLIHGQPLGDGDWGNFSAGVFKGIGQRHFFNEQEIRTLYRNFKIVDIQLQRQTSLEHNNRGHEELIVIAEHP